MSKYSYGDACTSSHGTMVCSVCGQKIAVGRYRYYVKSKAHDWSYRAQHEACCQDDPTWAEIDQRIADAEQRRIDLSKACAAFKATWGVDELDEYIIGESA